RPVGVEAEAVLEIDAVAHFVERLAAELAEVASPESVLVVAADVLVTPGHRLARGEQRNRRRNQDLVHCSLPQQSAVARYAKANNAFGFGKPPHMVPMGKVPYVKRE